jgi:Ni/Fe-hydrogenase subunit HybB-like protein
MRVANRPLALILAAALLAGAVIVIAEVIGFAVGHSPLLVPWRTWFRWADATHWNATVVQVWAVILMVVGLILLILELKPPRATRLSLETTDKATDATVTRRGLARMLRTEAARVDGITGATVKVSRLRARVTAASSARGQVAATALTEPLTEALNARLDGLDMRHAPRLSVRVVPGRP